MSVTEVGFFILSEMENFKTSPSLFSDKTLRKISKTIFERRKNCVHREKTDVKKKKVLDDGKFLRLPLEKLELFYVCV